MKTRLLHAFALLTTLPLIAADLPPDSTEPMGQSFTATTDAGALQVALVGSGSSHHFPRDFLATDAATLKAAIDKVDVAATPNLEEALALLEDADVLVFSGNHQQWGSARFQKALRDFAGDGKGLVFLHAATWNHPWKDYNKRFIGGRTPSHGKGDFTVTVTDGDSPVTAGVPKTFEIWDENYRFQLEEKDRVHVCCENQPDQTDGPIPSVWTVKDPKAKIVCITLGHDQRAHGNEAFKKLLVNAVEWAGGR
jgi:type 1 glutamine amidotransferase